MANRTYIQMYVKGYEAGRKDISDQLYNELKNLSGILDENPELVERVVKERVSLVKRIRSFRLLKPTGTIFEHEWLFYERMIIGTWEHEQLERERRERILSLKDEVYCIIDEPILFPDDNRTMSPKEYGMKLRRKKNDYLYNDYER